MRSNVTRGGLISFERNRYSVPASFANRPVSLRVYPDRLVVAAEGQILCEHVRVIQRSHQLPPRTIYDWRHYLEVLQRKPGALRNGAPFAEFPLASGAIIIMLRSLKVHGMAQAVTDLMEQGAPAFDAAVPMLAQLLKAEVAEREVRSIAYHMKAARFPAYKDLSGVDFAESEINEATVRQLHRGEFMGGTQNVVLIGGPGTGKTHVATAFGVQSVEHHRRKFRFFSTIELVNTLEQEKAKGKPRQLAESLTKLDLVILDELGYLPFSTSGGALLCHLLSKIYERTSVVITTI